MLSRAILTIIFYLLSVNYENAFLFMLHKRPLFALKDNNPRL